MKKEFKYNRHDSLDQILLDLKKNGIKRKDFNKIYIETELNYDGCYYESDEPSIDLIIKYAQNS